MSTIDKIWVETTLLLKEKKKGVGVGGERQILNSIKNQATKMI